jgi:hypothetical protein
LRNATLGLLFKSEDGARTFPQNVDKLLPAYTATYPRDLYSSVHLQETFTGASLKYFRPKDDYLVHLYVCMYKGGPKSGPHTTTFNDLYLVYLLKSIPQHIHQLAEKSVNSIEKCTPCEVSIISCWQPTSQKSHKF